MSIKFEGEPPFYLGVAETAAAQVLDTNVIVRVTVSPSKARPKSVPVRFTISPEVAKSLAEQLVVAARTAENHKKSSRFGITRLIQRRPRQTYRIPIFIPTSHFRLHNWIFVGVDPRSCKPGHNNSGNLICSGHNSTIH